MKQLACKTILGLFMVLLSQQASAWWNEQWTYRVPITVDASVTGANIESTQTDFPVLVRLHAGNFQDFFLVRDDLSDLRFIAGDDKTPLKHAVESFDLINQLIYVWVKVPQVSGGIATERLWMYYGNADSVPVKDSAGIYPVEQSLALTFSPADAPVSDQTAYATAVDNQDVKILSASVIASGAQFAGNQFLQIQDTPAMRMVPENGVTFSAWIKPAGLQPDSILYSRSSGTSKFELGISGDLLYLQMHNGGSVFETPRSAQVALDTWQQVTFILGADNAQLLINGAVVGSIPLQWNEMGGNSYIGAAAEGERGFVGEMDNVDVARIARSVDWVKLAVANQGPEDKLLSIQPAEQLGSGGSGNVFTVILKSIDESGWTIIFLLGIMAAISWVVMIGKLLYIRIAKRDNAQFLAQFRLITSDDPALLDVEQSEDEKMLEESPIAQALLGKHDHFQSSPIYHLYHNVLKQVRGRIGKAAGASASGLSPAAVASIRASMDAEMTREMQKLNGQMVLLTIAISGGPFLGLLGTVVGVMVTFATIAATGDVNIAAIAPGVAAALATTVAGLFVAIPALFGYNYIFSRIKETMVDMRVFGDEFITRIAEYYGNE